MSHKLQRILIFSGAEDWLCVHYSDLLMNIEHLNSGLDWVVDQRRKGPCVRLFVLLDLIREKKIIRIDQISIWIFCRTQIGRCIA